MKRHLYQIIFFLILAAVSVTAQTSEFTYQGKLNDGGTAANATYEMQFRLYDNANAGQGTQHGSTVTKSPVVVSGGVFSTGLDFGVVPFAAGAERYLEISVRPAGSTGGYTALAPRQKLTSVPYAVKSQTAVTAETAVNAQQLAGVSGSQFVQTNDPRLSDPRQPMPGSASYIQNTETEQVGANFKIGGTGSAGILSATRYNLFGQPFLRPSANFSTVLLGFSAGNDTASGIGNTVLGDSAGTDLTTGSGNVFVGREAGSNTTTGHGNIFIGQATGLQNVTGSNNTILGGFIGAPDVSFATAIGQGASVGESNAVVIGRSADTVRIPGKINIGNFVTGAMTPLCLNGASFLVGTCSSSLRYKTNVADYKGGLDIVKQLRPITFNWKEGNFADMGLVAEEAAQVDPLLAIYTPKGEIDGIKYDRVGVILVNAVKEQQQQIDDQKKQNSELKKQVDDLKSEIEILRTLIICRTGMRPELCKEEK